MSGTDSKHSLERVQTLAEEAVKDALSASASTIPKLTELYDGAPLEPARNAQIENDMPTLVAEVVAVPPKVKASINSKKVDDLMMAMMPRIRLEVKRAVLQEMIEIEKVLCKKIEQDLIRAMMKELKDKQA